MYLRRHAALLSIALVALLVGCNKLKRETIEDSVKQSLASKGQHMQSVQCPDGLDFKAQTFDCKGVDHAGKTADIKVTVTPTSGGKADVRYSTVIDGKPYSN